MKFNCYGQELTEDNYYIPRKMDYMKSPETPDYAKWLNHSDNNGFDVLKVDENGKFRRKIILPIGKKLCRYGDNKGAYSTDIGTGFEKLSLPYKKESLPYHEYIVVGECEAECVVEEGIAAPGFDHPGGGIQYFQHIQINKSIEKKILKEDISWLENLK